MQATENKKLASRYHDVSPVSDGRYPCSAPEVRRGFGQRRRLRSQYPVAIQGHTEPT
jgi:hypothetical protein